MKTETKKERLPYLAATTAIIYLDSADSLCQASSGVQANSNISDLQINEWGEF